MAVMPPPPFRLLLAEGPRAAWTVARLAARWRSLGGAAGTGTVMVMPGLFNSDRSNIVLRAFLRRLGHDARGWGLGRNYGARTIGAEAEMLITAVERLAAQSGGPVALVGVSLGGIMARLVAQRRPDLVRCVVTVSSPYAAHPRATRVWRLFQWLTGDNVDDPKVDALRAEIAAPLSVPATAIWSASDGLVAGGACHGDDCEGVEVVSGHLGVQIHPQALLAVAAALGATR
ncbi:esterase/lipase family protein [Sphingomonas sp. RS2018]